MNPTQFKTFRDQAIREHMSDVDPDKTLVDAWKNVPCPGDVAGVRELLLFVREARGKADVTVIENPTEHRIGFSFSSPEGPRRAMLNVVAFRCLTTDEKDSLREEFRDLSDDSIGDLKGSDGRRKLVGLGPNQDAGWFLDIPPVCASRPAEEIPAEFPPVNVGDLSIPRPESAVSPLGRPVFVDSAKAQRGWVRATIPDQKIEVSFDTWRASR